MYHQADEVLEVTNFSVGKDEVPSTQLHLKVTLKNALSPLGTSSETTVTGNE